MRAWNVFVACLGIVACSADQPTQPTVVGERAGRSVMDSATYVNEGYAAASYFDLGDQVTDFINSNHDFRAQAMATWAALSDVKVNVGSKLINE